MEYQETYHEASNMIRNDFYIDDLLSGGDKVPVLQKRKVELTNILNSAEVVLIHKWNSNKSSIVNNNLELPIIPSGDEIKTLGKGWNATTDCLQYKT